MMPELSVVSTFKVPLSIEAYQLAQHFWQQHRDRAKAKQVYLNTLAVSAVNFYLRCLGIESNWAASCSRNLVYQTLMDVADLEIPNLGKLECRPVLPEAEVVYIPPEVWAERIGYVAVQLDASLQEATLLGFTEIVPESGEVPIAQLQAIAQLPARIQQIQPAKLSQKRVNLSQWFENLFDVGWQSLETLLAANHHTLALRHGHIPGLHENSVQGVKLIDLGLQIGNQFLAMLITLVPESDGQVSVIVQLHPTGTENYLPPNIKLTLLLESGTPPSVQSRYQDNYIQLKRFRGRPGECFNIQVAYGGIGVTENFII